MSTDMHKLKMQSSEKICDYCNVRYPDERSLMVHEFIHIDRDMDYFRSCSELSDYLPKARQLFPSGIRNNRFLEVSYRRVEMNYPGIGKRYSRMLMISDAIDELIYLCKKYPVRESEDSSSESLKSNVKSMAEKTPISSTTPPNYSMPDSYAFCGYSDLESFSPASPSSNEASSEESESESEAQIEKEQLDNTKVPQTNLTRVSKRESSTDSGYGSPQKCSSEFIKKVSMPEYESSDSYSKTEIDELLKNIVSYAAGGENCFKTVNLDEFKSVVNTPILNEFAVLQNRKLMVRDSNKLIVDSDGNMNDTEINPIKKIDEKLYSMPQILC